MEIEKRDGRKVPFEKEKIIQAIERAWLSLYEDVDRDVIDSIASSIERMNKDMHVEDIQNIVEKKLMASSFKDVARAYIRYRHTRELVREINTTDKTIRELLDGDNDYWSSENSNKNARVVTTQRDYIAGITSTDITRRLLLPQDIVKAHDEGILHFHK